MQADRAVALLATTPLFAGMPEADLRQIARGCTERAFRKKEIVFHENDPGDSLFMVAEGLVKVYVTSDGGGRMVLAALGPPETFGELAVVDGGPRSASVEAIEPTRLLSLSRSVLLEAMRTRPAVAEVLLRSLGTVLRRMIEQAADLVFLDLHGRVAKLLVALGERAGNDALDLKVTQHDLAAMVGGSRQSLNLILHDFDRRGLIEFGGRTISLTDVSALRRRAGMSG